MKKKEYPEKLMLDRFLEDIDCLPEIGERFIKCYNEGNACELIKILSKQRKVQLAKVHMEQEKLDCIDYLIYKMRSKNNE